MSVGTTNVHATGVVLGARGLLITGPSGSGKTTLALALVDAWQRRGRFARLVADDQILVSVAAGRLLAAAPPPIAGLVEICGIGPVPAPHLGIAVVDAICTLVPEGDAPRFQESRVEAILGCRIPRIELAARNLVAAIPALTAWIARLEGA